MIIHFNNDFFGQTLSRFGGSGENGKNQHAEGSQVFSFSRTNQNRRSNEDSKSTVEGRKHEKGPSISPPKQETNLFLDFSFEFERTPTNFDKRIAIPVEIFGSQVSGLQNCGAGHENLLARRGPERTTQSIRNCGGRLFGHFGMNRRQQAMKNSSQPSRYFLRFALALRTLDAASGSHPASLRRQTLQERPPLTPSAQNQTDRLVTRT